MIMGTWCHNPDRVVQGDNSCVPCISYKKNESMLKKKKNFFRPNYGNAANQSMFANKYVRRLIVGYR